MEGRERGQGLKGQSEGTESTRRGLSSKRPRSGGGAPPSLCLSLVGPKAGESVVLGAWRASAFGL